MAMERAGIAEPPVMPMEATAGLAMLLLQAICDRAAFRGLLFGDDAEARRHRWREPNAHQISAPSRAEPHVAAARGIAMTDSMTDLTTELNPPPRLLLGPGPINADPRVLRAMSMPLLGQFDPVFTAYMDETMALLRRLFQTTNHWAFLVNGTARAGIEAILVSLIAPGDRVLIPVFGRFGHLLCEIAERAGGEVRSIETEWGTVFAPETIEDAVKEIRPKVVALAHGDTSTTMAQPLEEIGAICRRRGALLYVDATATIGGMDLMVDAWQIDAVSAGLQKCLSGPPGSAPVTFNERVVEAVLRRKHVEKGIEPEGFVPGEGPRIGSNYFDLPMLMDYWSELRLNHHTEFDIDALCRPRMRAHRARRGAGRPASSATP